MGAKVPDVRLPLSVQVKRLPANRGKALSMQVYTPGGNLLRAHEVIEALERGKIAARIGKSKAEAPYADLMELSTKVDVLRGTTPIRPIELADLGTVMEIKIEGESQRRKVVFVNGRSSHLKVEDFYGRAHAAPEGFRLAFAQMIKKESSIGIKCIGEVNYPILDIDIRIDGTIIPLGKISGLEPILEGLNASKRMVEASATNPDAPVFVGFRGYFFEIIG